MISYDDIDEYHNDKEDYYDDNHANFDQGFDEWKSSYIKQGLKKWGKGVCWSWCESGLCDEDFNCGMAHPILRIESLPVGRGCCIEIKSSREIIGLPVNDKSSGTRLHVIESAIKGIGFTEKDEDSSKHDQEPLIFDSDAIFLNVPYAEKDFAKELGAYWNPDTRKWYVSAGLDLQPFEKWSPKVDGKYIASSLTYDDVAYLNTSFQEKDEVKALGAWWDADKKKWYVPSGKSLRPFLKWSPVVNGQPVVRTQISTPTFISKDVDRKSAIAQLRILRGFSNAMFDFTYNKRSAKDTPATAINDIGQKRKADDEAETLGMKRNRCSSPERDDRKLPATVTPQK